MQHRDLILQIAEQHQAAMGRMDELVRKFDAIQEQTEVIRRDMLKLYDELVEALNDAKGE